MLGVFVVGGGGGGANMNGGSSGFFKYDEIGPLSGTINIAISIGQGGSGTSSGSGATDGDQTKVTLSGSSVNAMIVAPFGES